MGSLVAGVGPLGWSHPAVSALDAPLPEFQQGTESIKKPF